MAPANTPALQRYMKQRALTDQGQGPSGGGGAPATPVGPGIADPFNSGQQAQPLVNPDDAMNEFDPRRRPRPYMDNGQNMWADMPIPGNSQC